MKRFFKNLIPAFLALLVFSFVSNALQAQALNSIPYTWKNIQLSGGGFVDGIIFHPKAKDVRYARTDMGGAYRWNESTRAWEPMLDWISYQDLNLMGVESIALDPSNPDLVYMACGTYTNAGTPDGAILISKDRGKTFKRVNVPIKFGGNENGRGNGERMAVDPNFSNIIYLGTRHAGLWKSVDAGATWQKVASFPAIKEELTEQEKREWWTQGSGIDMVVFDKAEKSKEASSIYVCVSVMQQNNILKSKDGGKTWQAIKEQPTHYRPTHAILADNQMLYVTYGTNPGPAPMKNGAVWKFNIRKNTWTEISPEKHDPLDKNAFGYAAISVDASNVDHLIVSSFSKGKDGDEIWRSLDGGKTWKSVFTLASKWDRSNAPYTIHTPLHWMFDIEIDPFNPDHALFTTGYGGWETFNLRHSDQNKPVDWSIMSKGIEETVCLELCSPKKGAQVLTAIGDYCGFAHYDLDHVVAEGCYDNPHFSNTNGIAAAENNPDIIVRVGRASYHQAGQNIGYSTDGGKTWKPSPSVPTANCAYGHIAVSSDGSSWIWSPERADVYVTTDMGATWKKVADLPQNTRVVADRINPKKFYAMDLFGGKLYKSEDGGMTFNTSELKLSDGLPTPSKNRGDDRGGQDRIYASPDQEGDLYLALFNGLYHIAADGSFLKLDQVDEIHAFGFGKHAPDAKASALYLVGTVNKQRGIFQSIDLGKTWKRINDDDHQWGLVLHISGDPKVFGRVYVGTHGRGILYGDPK